MAQANQDQSDYWNGEAGARWARHQAVLDAVFAPLTEALFDRAALAPGGQALDIGCGAGAVAIEAARRLGPGGAVLAVDLSAPLLSVARARTAVPAPDRAPVDWRLADAQTDDLGTARFAHALSRFGVMFFEDSVAAFANVARALAPGGRLTFLCWQGLAENPWVTVPRAAVLPLLPAEAAGAVPDPDAPGPFRFARVDALGRLLARAGWREVTCEPLHRPLLLGRAGDGSARAAAETAALFVLELGPVSRLVREETEAVRAAARTAVIDRLEPLAADGMVCLDAACWLVSARR